MQLFIDLWSILKMPGNWVRKKKTEKMEQATTDKVEPLNTKAKPNKTLSKQSSLPTLVILPCPSPMEWAAPRWKTIAQPFGHSSASMA